VDAGPGAFARLGEAKLSLADLDIVLLTHLHIDHVGELPGLFKARAVSSRGPISFRVFGPEGRTGGGDNASFPATSRWLDLMFGPRGAFPYLRNFSAPITWHAVDLPANAKPGAKPRQILHEGKLMISASAGHHRDAPAILYRVDYAGRNVTFSGDIDSQGLPALTTIAHASDLLVFNSVVLDPPESPEVLYTLHSSPRAIGAVAGSAGVKRLLLSHLSPAVDAARQSVLDSIAERFHGPVSFAEDGLRLGF
jgi:ribonuclease BN (tRNA processing enzyme)